ncbi:Glutathione S-transferase 1 [Acropora cervicornis]|uniref:glutathione transferase n=1 Tax=Acropora cervicornis TaxID=6130 RepID=A0AAD9QVH2_ACRCE|nr:Glutathione S-transferase 1 [Acropora cervicornis]
MPRYKLTYFSIRGKAECIRITFAVGGVEFENVRIKPEEWHSKLKQSGLSPTGKLPLLEVDGKVLTASKAILSYVARVVGLAPEESFNIAQADMLGDVIADLEDNLTAGFMETDPDKKEKALSAANEKVLQRCGYFEKLLSSNSKQGFFFEDKLTYGDLVVFTFLNSYFLKGSSEGIPDQLKDFPCLCTWYELVRTQPKVLEWLQNPPTDMFEYIY